MSQKIYSLSRDCSLQSVDDGAVILRVTDGQIYSCNETTLAFLRLVDGKRSFPEIVAAFRQEYQIDEETASRDLSALAQDMLAEGVIVQAN